MASITYANGALVLSTPFHRALVEEIKLLPSADRAADMYQKAQLLLGNP